MSRPKKRIWETVMTPGSAGAFHMPASARLRSMPRSVADAQGEGHVIPVLDVRELLHLFIGDVSHFLRPDGDKRCCPCPLPLVGRLRAC